MARFKFSYEDAIAEGKRRILHRKQTPEYVANILTLTYGFNPKQRIKLLEELEAYHADLYK